MKVYITLKNSFRSKESARKIKVKYLDIDVHSLYNMIIGKFIFSQLGATLSMLYLCMKYSLLNRRVMVI